MLEAALSIDGNRSDKPAPTARDPGWHQTCRGRIRVHHDRIRTMKVSSNELLLALRAPNSGWLAALVCALDEALQDPDFGEPQRALVRGLIDQGSVPAAVADAANERLARFEQT